MDRPPDFRLETPFAVSAADPAFDEANPDSSTADHQSLAPWLTAIKRRAPIACRRCRRMRSKCQHDKAQPPCKSCKEAGLTEADCIFPARGQPGTDREYRHPRQRAPRAPKPTAAAVAAAAADGRVSAPRPRSLSGAGQAVDEWLDMPPLEDIIDAVDRFTKSYHQLSFIPKQQFRKKLEQDHRSVNIFLLLGILGISARMTPALIKEYGSGMQAAEHFMGRAVEIASSEIYLGPTLERCQAFYLLSLAQQGSGLKNDSYLNIGIATRMSTLMQLHREETYEMQNPTTESIISAESARRTMWMLHSQDSLHSGPYSPVTLGAPDITTLLPCDEDDFAAGCQPKSRAALPDSPPANERPDLVRDPGRSLFGSLMQIHHYWGMVSRRAATFGHEVCPWTPQSEFCKMRRKLKDWEHGLPTEHRYAKPQLHYFKYRGLDLAYLSVTMMPRLCNIVLRRPYLQDVINIDTKGPHERTFFTAVATDMFVNVYELFQQIDAQFTGRALEESVGAQITSFCVYVCGLFSTYLCRYPHVCPDPAIAQQGPAMVKRTKAILSECKQVWPLASRWVESMERAFHEPQGSITNEGSMADGKDPVPQAWLKRSTAPPKPTYISLPGIDAPEQIAQGSPTNSLSGHYSRHNSQSHMVPPTQSLPIYHEHRPNYPIANVHHHQPTALPAPIPFNPQSHISNMVAASPQNQMYMPPPGDNLAMMMPPYGAPPPAPTTHQQQPYVVAAPGAQYYPVAGPRSDGFENELQVYMGGNTNTMPPSSWGGGY